MIEKMKFLNLTGPKDDIDRVVDQYLSKYEIQLENTLSELKSVQNISPYSDINPYKETLQKANVLADMVKNTDIPSRSITLEEAVNIIETIDKELSSLREEQHNLETELSKCKESLTDIAHFKDLHYNIQDILHFEHVKFRFGKISQEYFAKFEKYIYDDLYTLFYKCQSDKDYVWGVYFVPSEEVTKIDAVYSSMHFERFYLKDEYDGTPEEAYQDLEKEIQGLNEKLNQTNERISSKLSSSGGDILLARQRLEKLSANFDVRKLAACTEDKEETFYILCGWMTEKDAAAFSEEVKTDKNLYCIIEDDHNNTYSKPPTKLKNPKIFKPFEMFIRMYGLPDYNEFDPTIFVAITYAFIFGAMFGDVGQGICLTIGGFLLYKFKKMDLAAIVGTAGIFSTFFGFMFGSIFGFEDIIDAVWLRPIEHMTQLPFIGRLNTVFIVAIVLGMGLIMLTMIFHIINGFKAHNLEAALFDTNGIAGFVFYAAVVLTIFLFMTGNSLPAVIVLVVMFVIPLLVMALKEPLAALLEKKSEVMPKGKVIFFVQAFFELFEVLLSYFSNTLSFVRIGAFAVSHAAMMEVVLMLAGAENGGSPNWIVVVLGNLFVCGMEGLIVGIQVLRLEYYEFFSRFYKGSGREFKPYSTKASIQEKH